MALHPFTNSNNSGSDIGWDAYAEKYSRLDTPGSIYGLTKELMHSVVTRHFEDRNELRVLDVNCGTGNDFDYFLKNGWDVIGVDGSAGMLSVAHTKFLDAIENGQLNLLSGQLEEWTTTEDLGGPFDLIYSITGGFSYIDDSQLAEFNKNLKEHLKPDGLLIVANLSSFCLMESVYCFITGQFNKAFRRKSGGLEVDIQGERHMMWLRGSTTLRDIYSKEFDIVSMVPLLTLTPPYQSGYSPPAWLTRVHRIVESTLMRWRIGVKISDQIITIARR